MLLTLCIGLFFLCTGLFKLSQTIIAKRKSEKATGVVLRFNESLQHSLGQDEDDLYPIVQYATKSGESITETYFVGSQFYTVGDKVSVCYNPSNPREFIIDDAVSTFIPALLFFFGLFIFMLGFFLK
jgi:hypothetical protein